MKNIHQIFLVILIATNLFFVKATALPNTTNAQISACQIGAIGAQALPGDQINVSAQGNSFSSGDWTFLQGFTVDPSKSEIGLGFLINVNGAGPGFYVLQTIIPANVENGATYIVRILHDTTIIDCGRIVIGGGIPVGGNPGPTVDCTKADVNKDGVVNSADAALIGLHTSPAPFDALYDINSDGKVDQLDITAALSCQAPAVNPTGENPCTTGPAGQCDTALGFIPTTVKGFTEKILSIAIGLAGGIAFILMVIGAIRVLASSGDPKAVGAGREMFVAAVAGLLFLIFAVLILQFIGLNILKYVPGIG